MDFIDVSSWIESSASSTKGTRDKLVLLKPGTDEEYFLKFPMVRDNRDYRPENWSEVLAYKIGNALGFNVLRYDLAVFNGRIGCISKNMINPNMNEALVEGHSILSRYDPSYDPSDKSTYWKYTFGFVQKALEDFNAGFFVEDFIKTLVFDAVIGNSDRHQSNWGIIQTYKLKSVPAKRDFRSLFKKQPEPIYVVSLSNRAAPIYDSGCCLGREFGEEQLLMYLNIQSKFDKYIRKGMAELRTGLTNEKSSHEELLRFIKNTDNARWSSCLMGEIERVRRTYNPDLMRNLIADVDSRFPEQYKEEYGITDARKEFIIRVIDTRIKKLINI